MVTAIYAVLLLALIILPIQWLTLSSRNQKRKKAKALLNEFNEAGANYGLAFSSQEILHNTIIGLDGIQRKLLLVETEYDEAFQPTLINLAEMKECKVIKQYKKLQGEEGSFEPQKPKLENIRLHFDLPGKAPVDVVFFTEGVKNANDAIALENKARDWEVMLMKMQGTLLKTA